MNISNLSGTHVVDLTVDAVLQWLICGDWVSLQHFTFNGVGNSLWTTFYMLCFLSFQSWGWGILFPSV